MDRFEWLQSSALLFGELVLCSVSNVQLYDGEEKSRFEGGQLQVTSHRLLWRPASSSRARERGLALSLRRVVLVEEESASLFHCAKARVTVSSRSESGAVGGGPLAHSRYNHVKLAFRGSSGDVNTVVQQLGAALQRQQWLKTDGLGTAGDAHIRPQQRPVGIVGIEKTLVERQTRQQQIISEAFADLAQLMERAREMVTASRRLSQQLHARQGGISADETVQLQSHLLSLGVADPALRSSGHFHSQLAAEMCSVLEPVVRSAGGLLPLTDAYCRLNRARGLELLAPEDLMAAGRLLERLRLPLRCRRLESGVWVLQPADVDEQRVAVETGQLLQTASEGRLTAEILAEDTGVSVLLASQRLLEAERCGVACRDDSIEGLAFYYNRLLHDSAAL